MTANPTPHPRQAARVVDSIEEAAELTRQGTNAVLVVSPDEEAVAYPTGGPGRLALMVGRIDDPAVIAAAREMAGELS